MFSLGPRKILHTKFNTMESPRILYIDAFDSFTNNVIGLLQQTLQSDVTTIKINDEDAAANFASLVPTFDAVVVGPGPGHPALESDIGLITKLWQLDADEVVPVLGVCLGFQSLCHSAGASVPKLPFPRHGIVTQPVHNNTDIFSGLGEMQVTQYHSLHADLGLETKNSISWSPTKKCPTLQPLAWDTSDDKNGPVLMAVKHTDKPYWGVQFHPESICTSAEGKRLVSTWWEQACAWNKSRKVQPLPKLNLRVDSPFQSGGTSLSNESTTSSLAKDLVLSQDACLDWAVHAAGSLTPSALTEALGLSKNEVVLLDSQGHATGQYSIIGLVSPNETMKVTYSVGSGLLKYGISEEKSKSIQVDSLEDVWPLLSETLDLHNPRLNKENISLPIDSPFWGGFMGYISYEAGLETINVHSGHQNTIPDINFAFIHRSLVFDHGKNQIFVQSLLPDDHEWVVTLGKILDGVVALSKVAPNHQSTQQDIDDKTLSTSLRNAHMSRPTGEAYRSKVLACQEYLASGDSYELCLTDETEILIPTSDNLDPWLLYKRLRRNNPAPFGAYLNLPGVTVVGSSPERFLRWTRSGHCQFRPIKGTVKKSPEMTRENAHAILNSSKERAENLMIVDLIRHDLCGVVGADKTWVSKLMVVEEYQTVYQLVSVIEGQLPDERNSSSPRGIDVLKASLSPGSMTGAPKKRSCEILVNDIEKRSRGIYSGVLGYMDVGGAGDFSVVIRTAVKAGLTSDGAFESWRVGAGGAVTIQSSAEGEFEEMEIKASSVLGALGFL